MVNHKQGLVYGGIDTHADTHHVAVVDAHGRPLGDIQIPATTVGYRTAVLFLQSWPGLAIVGVERTGSYGAAVTREITIAGMTVREVNRPNQFDRRNRGKTDTFDAYSAAEAVLSGRATAAPKARTGSSNPCAFCAPPGHLQSKSAPPPSTRSRRCSSPGQRIYGPATKA